MSTRAEIVDLALKVVREELPGVRSDVHKRIAERIAKPLADSFRETAKRANDLNMTLTKLASTMNEAQRILAKRKQDGTHV